MTKYTVCAKRKAANTVTTAPWGENQEVAKHHFSSKRTEILLVTISKCVISTAPSRFILQKRTSCFGYKNDFTHNSIRR